MSETAQAVNFGTVNESWQKYMPYCELFIMGQENTSLIGSYFCQSVDSQHKCILVCEYHMME